MDHLRFTEADILLAKKVSILLASNAKFTVNAQENVELTKCLKFLQELPMKIEGHIFEPVAIHQAPEKAAEKKKSKKSSK